MLAAANSTIMPPAQAAARFLLQYYDIPDVGPAAARPFRDQGARHQSRALGLLYRTDDQKRKAVSLTHVAENAINNGLAATHPLLLELHQALAQHAPGSEDKVA